MKSNYDVLGNYIRLIDTRNKDKVTNKVMGINIDKFFMPSVANVIGTDLSKYKLITKGKFACNPMHVGRDERLPVALYEEVEPALVSPAYFMFEIIDNTVLDENYLMMWFRRAEFDRICWLHTDGSVRGGITWDDICRMEIPVPEIGEQRKIVEAYKIVEDRIEIKRKINDNLDALALAIYRKYFIEGIEPDNLPLGWSMGTLKDIYQFQYGKGNTNPDNGGQYPIYGSNGVIGGYHEYNNEDEPVIGHIGAAGSLNFAFGKHYVTYNGIMCNILVPRNIYFGYLTLYAQNLATQVRGSTQPFISYDMLYEIKTVLPTDEVLDDFHSKISLLMKYKREILTEITKLEQLQTIMQGQLPSI